MNQRLKRLKGFTLIEVLVVIIIIGILTTVSIVALNSSRVKARDSRRLSDIKQLQTALELYNADEFNYSQAITPGQPLIGLSSKKLICQRFRIIHLQ